MLSSEKRENLSSTPSILAVALNSLGCDVEFHGSQYYNECEKSCDSNIIKINANNYFDFDTSEYDLIVASNCSNKIVDFRGLSDEIKKVWLYYEDFDAPIVPKGTDFIWTSKNYFDLIKFCNPFWYKKTPTFIDFVKAMVFPENWENPIPYSEREIEFSYNGGLTYNADPVRNYFMIDRVRLCKELAQIEPRFKFPAALRRCTTNVWKKDFRNTKINLHMSQNFGVGQGLYESGLCECATIEYIPKEMLIADGFELDVDCIQVDTPKQAADAFYWFKEHPRMAEAMGKKLHQKALQHTYSSVIPALFEALCEMGFSKSDFPELIFKKTEVKNLNEK